MSACQNSLSQSLLSLLLPAMDFLIVSILFHYLAFEAAKGVIYLTSGFSALNMMLPASKESWYRLHYGDRNVCL
jgi:hypothetical protein